MGEVSSIYCDVGEVLSIYKGPCLKLCGHVFEGVRMVGPNEVIISTHDNES